MIWNNRDILFRNKSLFLKNWFDKHIFLVNQLFNHNGHLMSYNEFLLFFKFPVTPKEYAIVFDAIPSGIIMLIKSAFTPPPGAITVSNIVESYVGKICFSSHKHNKNIRALFQKELVTIPYVVSYWNTLVEDINWKKIWIIPNRYLITNKVREVSFKMLHKFYPANHYMLKFKRDIKVNCSFCGDHPETV